MRTNALIRIAIYSVLILFLLGVLLGVLFFDLYIFDGRVHIGTREDVIEVTEAPYAVMDQHITAQVQNIEIEWVAGSITIETSENVSDIHVQEHNFHGDDYQMVCRQSGQTLKIQFCEESFKFPSLGIDTDGSKDLIITVPANWVCNKLEVDAASAEVNIHDLQINELDFDGASGNLILDNCDIVFLDIDTASGDVEFSGKLKELDFDAASANFYGEFTAYPHRMSLDAASGDMEIVLPSYSGFTCKLDSMNGSFETDFPIMKKDNSTYVCGEGDLVIDVSAMSGDVRILKGIDAPQ